MVVVEEQEDYHFSDSDDSDDSDVDRYVFLARQPAPAGRRRHPVPEDGDRDACSSADDDDDEGDGTEGEEGSESEGGGRGVVGKRKKTPPPPPTTKPRLLELIIAPPPSGSESGSEGRHEKKARDRRAPTPREQGAEAEKKRSACVKRSRSPAGESDGNDRDDVAPAAAAAKTAGALSSGAASGRFPCSLCDRCFGSHQALGGHVLGHRKRTKIAAIIAAAATILDADDAREGSATVEVAEEAAKSIADQADKKEAVKKARRGKGKGNGEGTSSDEGKTVDDAAARGDHQDDDGGQRHKRMRKVHGKGSKGGVREPVFAGSHDDDVNGNGGSDNKCNPVGVSGHGCFTDGNSRRKTDIGTASSNRKVDVVAGTCHEGANGNGNGNGNVCRTMYKCKVCGTECLTGRALGGHMRKHRKRPPVDGGGREDRSPSPATDDDCRIPLARLFGAETSFLQT